MIIISHRGYWKKTSEKNTETAFRRSFSLGFGVETDVRDFAEDLVISHDIPDSHSMSFEYFISIMVEYDNKLPLALNIKSDGLCEKLNKILKRNDITNYFVFDMSIPDTLQYKKNAIKYFTRQSEYEVAPIFYNDSAGVWIDSNSIQKHVSNNKNVCIVSPELHQRNYDVIWGKYKKIENNMRVMLCTDYPEKAQKFFNE